MSGIGFLSARERDTLRAVCDTFVPRLAPPPGTRDAAVVAYWQRNAGDLDVATAVEETLGLEMTPTQQRQIKLALGLLARPAAMHLLTGRGTPFAARSLLGREIVLRGWATSPLPPLRQAYTAFKRLTGFHFFAHAAPDGANPNATLLGYPGITLPPPAPSANPAHPLTPRTIDRDTTLDADVCVIGSGAGGGVAAALLAQAGRRVIVLEAGGWNTEADFDAQEEKGWERLFMRRGALATADGGMLVMAGRTLGGGTTVNWTTSFRPPPALLAEWATRAGLPELLDPALGASYAAVEQRLHIHVADTPLNANNRVVLEGTAALGLPGARNPRNVTVCGSCGVCHFGCRWGAKQGTMRTYLQDAFDAGAMLIPDCYADRVLLEGGRAVGVVAHVRRPVQERDPAAPAPRLTVRAPLVVVAGGALESPALLLRSGLRHWAIGRHLYLHPATGVLGEFAAPVVAWQGAMQAAYSDALADLSGDGYGVRLEAVPIYPGFGAIVTPWTGARVFRQQMGRLAHYSALLVLTRDRVPGRVVLDGAGAPQLVYQPSAESRRLLLRGVQVGARVVLAAGAREVRSLQTRPVRLAAGGDPARFDAAVAAAGTAPHQMLVGSAHQMGTCRMGADPAQSVVDSRCAVHGVPGLYVCDTSIFPASSGVNPMLTTMGLVHWALSRSLR
ncbi:MAG TPA: GMC family oxidoreductase [Chloroflexia bacterium]|nr:GMC family oxidoreductase [Chloroflexia bacterium]